MAIEIEGEMVEVFDAHTHLNQRPSQSGSRIESAGTSGFTPRKGYTDVMMIEDMDEAGVDKVLAFSGASPSTDYSAKNDGVAEAIKKYPDRIMGFCWINPHFGPEASVKAIDRYIKELGFRGIKLNPPIDWFYPTNEALLFPIMDKAREYKVPVLFHCGDSVMASPTLVAELASHYTDVPIILGHMGLFDGVKQATIAAKKADNLFLETSICTWMDHFFGPAVKSVGPSKLVYGSDHPYNPFGLEIDKLVKYAPRYTGLTTADLKLILSGNIRKILSCHWC
ncbi:amidohydrolase family protein [Chloroflexota bacterium]